MASLAHQLSRTALRPVAAFRSPACTCRRTAAIVRPSSCYTSFLGGSFVPSLLAKPSPSRGSLTVLAAGGKSMGCTEEGTRRKRRRVSGFRTRKLTKSGRAILKARRKKGRHALAPASETSSGGKKH